VSRLPVGHTSIFTGKSRKDGLQLNVEYEDHLVFADMNIPNGFQGLSNMVHGGFLFGILDTLIWYVIIMETRKITMTRKTDMDFLKPVRCNAPYRALAKLERVEDRDIWATAWIEDNDKECYCRLTGLFREGKIINHARLFSHLDYSDVTPEIKDFFVSLGKK